MKQTKLLFTLLMAIVMMAMSPTKVWAEGEVSTISDGSSFTTDITSNGTYYPFTPATTGYYSFTFSQAVQAAVIDDDWNFYSSLQVCTTQKSFTKLVAGDTYYLALLSTGDAITGATVTVAACDAPTTTSTMTGTTTTETVSAYGVKYVKYVPTANHRYSVSVTGANDASAVVLEKKGTDDYSGAFCTWVDDGWVYLFENGKEYALGLCNSAAEEKELTLTLNEDNATPFINGTSYTISTLESLGEIMLRLTPTETKEYTFSVNKEYVLIQVATEDGWIWTENDATSISAALTAGKTYYIDIYNTWNETSNNITLTVSGGGVQPALALGDNTSINVATASGGGYVSDLIPFTPAESATYSFAMQGQAGCSVGIFPTASLENALGTNSLALEHDVTYYVAVMSTSQITNGTLVVTKEGSGEGGEGGNEGTFTQDANGTVLTMSEEGNLVNIAKDESVYYAFTPTEAGTYRFYSYGTGANLDVWFYDSEDNDLDYIGQNNGTDHSTNSYDFDKTIELEANTTIKVEIMCEDGGGDAVNYPVYIVKQNSGSGGETTLPALTVSTNNMTFPACNGDNIATFTPTEAGDYKFEVGPTWKSFALYAEGSSSPLAENTSTNDFTATSLVADQTYYIHMYNLIATTGSITITKVNGEGGGSGSGGETPTYTALTVNDNTAHIYAYDKSNSSDPKYFFTFTPTEPGEYTISFSDNGSSINVYAGFGDNANSMAASPGTTLTTPELTAQTTYNLYVDGNEDEYESATITITKVNGESGGSGEGGETTNVLTVDENYVDIPGIGTATFSFTPETTGWYRFHSEGENDMELNDITLNGESVFSTAVGSDDYDSDYNFKQSIPLTAGSTYLLGISSYGDNAVEDCKIVVSYVTPSVLKLDDNSVTIPDYEIATYTFTPTETGSYRFHTEGDEDLEIIDITLNGESVFSTAEGKNDVDSNNENYNFDWSIQLTKGNTYLLAINECDLDAVEDCNLVVSYEGSGSGGETPTYTALTVNDNEAHIYKYDSENSSDPNYYFTFTPTESGEYTFSFSNDGSPINVYAALLTDINGNSNVGQANGASSFATGALTAEHTYYLCVVGGAHDYPSATITITKVNGSGSSYQAVQEGQANVNEITIPASQGSELVQFTAPATFRFQFKTIASDYNVSLYSGVPGEEGTTCFASGLGECQYDCTMNQTYYILLSKNITMSADEQIGLSILRVHQREMSYEWGTVCLPFPINYDPNNGNYKLYMPTKATSSELTFLEYPAGNISQGSPMAVKAVGSKNAETQKYTINIVAGNESLSMFPAKAEVVGDYTMKGTFTEKTNQTGIYFIAQNKFWWAEDAITVPAYRAYLEGPAPSNGAKAFSIVVEDETDGISQMYDERCTMYDGKFIENGRVVIIRNGQKHNLNGQAIQ